MTAKIDSPLSTRAGEAMSEDRRTVFLLDVDDTLLDNEMALEVPLDLVGVSI